MSLEKDMTEETKVDVEKEIEIAAVPEPGVDNADNITFKSEDIDADRLLSDILKLDKDNHSNCQIMFLLERLHDIQDGMTLDDVPEEKKEWIEDMQIENAALDIFSLDGETSCLNFVFDTEKDIYIREINDIMNRYRIAQQQLQEDELGKNDLIMLSVLLMPYETEYQAFLQFAFPFWWGRVVGDTGKGNIMTLMFHNDNIDAIQIDMTEDELSTIKADVLRDINNGMGGDLFE